MTTDRPLVIVRADGSSVMGLGHVYRATSLAQMLLPEYRLWLCCRQLPAALLPWLDSIYEHRSEIPVGRSVDQEIDDVLRIARTVPSCPDRRPIIILDGYHFGTAYQKKIAQSGIASLCIDDVHRSEFHTDAVINHAPGVRNFYDGLVQPGRLYTGLEYALLRPPFLAAAAAGPADRESMATSSPRVFICFGGSDHQGLSILAAEQLLDAGYSVVLVAGAAFRHQARTDQLAQARDSLTVYRNLSAERMSAVMGECDLAIVPASSILYEVCSMRLPAVAGYYVDNQRRIYEGFLREKLIYGVGEFSASTDYVSSIRELLPRLDEWRDRQTRALDGGSGNRIRTLVESITR